MKFPRASFTSAKRAVSRAETGGKQSIDMGENKCKVRPFSYSHFLSKFHESSKNVYLIFKGSTNKHIFWQLCGQTNCQ